MAMRDCEGGIDGYYYGDDYTLSEEVNIRKQMDTLNSDGNGKIILKHGIYVAENNDNWLDSYKVTMEVRETEKSYIFRLLDFQSRYSASHIQMLFRDSERVVIKKDRGGHAIRKWSDEDFTFYPYQAGIPYYFTKANNIKCRNEEKEERK